MFSVPFKESHEETYYEHIHKNNKKKALLDVNCEAEMGGLTCSYDQPVHYWNLIPKAKNGNKDETIGTDYVSIGENTVLV